MSPEFGGSGPFPVLPHDSCKSRQPIPGPRTGPEVLGFVRHSPVCQAPPHRGRRVSQIGTSEVLRGPSSEYPSDCGSLEREADYPGGIRRVRRPVWRSGVQAGIDRSRTGSGDPQDERTADGDPGRSRAKLVWENMLMPLVLLRRKNRLFPSLPIFSIGWRSAWIACLAPALTGQTFRLSSASASRPNHGRTFAWCLDEAE